MGKEYARIDEKMREWVSRQKMFFVSTAPLAADGLINNSPKGMDTFRILDDHTVAYLDLTGSGVETIAHLKENGRIVVMFCAFEGAPNIVRFYGKGEVFEIGEPRFEELAGEFPAEPGVRSIIIINVEKIRDSCGYSIPFYDYKGERDTLRKWADNKGEDGAKAYRDEENRQSLDGLPGFEA